MLLLAQDIATARVRDVIRAYAELGEIRFMRADDTPGEEPLEATVGAER